VEFVRKVHDPLGDWLSPLIAATNLLQVPNESLLCMLRDLCKLYILYLLCVCVGYFNDYNQLPPFPN